MHCIMREPSAQTIRREINLGCEPEMMEGDVDKGVR